MNRRTLKKPSARHAQAAIKSVIALEKQVWKAAQQRDLVDFRRLVPADAVMIFQSGVVPQPDYVTTMLERTISHYELRNMRGFMPPRIEITPSSTISRCACSSRRRMRSLPAAGNNRRLAAPTP